MRGTARIVNKALLRPILLFGVEKQLMIANLSICFPLLAASHFKFPQCVIGAGLFIVNHLLFLKTSKHDPHLAKLIKRSSRNFFISYYPPIGHPLSVSTWPVYSLPSLRAF